MGLRVRLHGRSGGWQVGADGVEKWLDALAGFAVEYGVT